MHITIFTANVRDNNDLNSKLHLFCINSWSRLIKYFESIGHTAEIKIFTPKDKEMQDFYKLKDWKFKRLSTEANAFRIYMLANYENYLWLDWDMYIPEDINSVGKLSFDENDYLFYRMFCIMYNHGNQKFFKDLFNKYLTDDFCCMHFDQDVVKHLELKEHTPKNWRRIFFHLAKIDSDKLLPIEWVSEENFTNISDYISQITTKVFFAKDTFPSIKGFNHIIFNCHNDRDLINFIKTFKTKAL